MSKDKTEFTYRSARKAKQLDILFDRTMYSAFPHIVRLDGDELLLAFRQAPKAERIQHTHPRSIITVVRSRDLGASWDCAEAAQLAAGGGQEFAPIYLGKGKVGGLLAMHEVVYTHEAERARLPHTHKNEHPFGNTGSYWCWSRNYGLTWRLHDAVLIDTHIQSCAPPIRLRDGTLLAPAYGSKNRSGVARSVLYRSEDQGATWSAAVTVAKGTARTRGYCEPCLLETGESCVLAAHRIGQVASGVPGCFWFNDSADGGKTWSKPWPTDILSGACPRLLKLKDGRILLTYGRRFEPYGIYATLSEDGGKSWGEEILLRKGKNGDLGYTSSSELEPGRVLTVSYAQNRHATTGIIGTFWELP